MAYLSRSLPAWFLRGGTSKGIFLSRHESWALRTRNTAVSLTGWVGGISSLSKICVVGPASAAQQRLGIQVEYTFVQVGIKDRTIDVSGNCGNLSSMIGVFARDQGMVGPPSPGSSKMTVRSFNTNTSKLIDTTFPVSSDGFAELERPEVAIAGVSGEASEIILEFVDPAGAGTGKGLLPTGKPMEEMELEGKRLSVSCVDAANPAVFVSADEIRALHPTGYDAYLARAESPETEQVSSTLEAIRRWGAQRMGLDPNIQATPKIAILGPPEKGEDILVHALSMGVLHRAVPMTLGLATGVAANTEGTLAWKIVQPKSGTAQMVTIRHPGGTVDVGARIDGGEVKSAKTVRTGRRLMEGRVYY
ncbi:hypothetical protein HMN09_00710100 [Mycena chlorophos]|uniref:Methylitaconate delta2-delta3-isomerase n=1 Tax=Mycena chlorophos TaxID=658473 RepID=A0A8H6SZ04_MYCCL|nr:hypothetical protein HMN09_00710100 [Mycena chlorophos]